MLTRIATRLKFDPPVCKSVIDIMGKLQEANKYWKELRKRASLQQDIFMEGLAEVHSQSGGTKFAGVLKPFCLQEKQRLSSPRIREAYGKIKNGGIIAMVAPDNQGEW